MLGRPEWIRARKNILKRTKDQIRMRLGEDPLELESYYQEFARQFSRPWQIASKSELLLAIAQSDLVFAADFHAFSQAQRTHLRILRDLEIKRPVVLFLEAIQARHQKYLDAYMLGELTENEFLKKVQWATHWGFPFAQYKPLLALARERQWPVVGINLYQSVRSTKSLHKRDDFAAQQIFHYHSKNGQALFYVVYGELHLAKKHLPQKVEKLMARQKLRSLTVFLNSERVYFKLLEQGQEHQVDVVRFAKNQFCVLLAPPWVQWQSYLLYLEKTFDSEFDDDTETEVDYLEHIYVAVKMLCHDLQIEVLSKDIAVYTSRDESVLQVVKHNVPRNHQRYLIFLIHHDRSFFIPKKNIFYLGRETVNHAAHLAGEYVHAQLSQRNNLVLQFPQDFLRCIWIEAIAFWLSKWINHKRTADTYEDLKAELAICQPKDQGREALKLALAQRAQEIAWENHSLKTYQLPKAQHKTSYLEAARILGGMLGEAFYFAYREQGLSRPEIMEILTFPVESTEFSEFYIQQLRLLAHVNDKLRGKARRERL